MVGLSGVLIVFRILDLRGNIGRDRLDGLESGSDLYQKCNYRPLHLPLHLHYIYIYSYSIHYAALNQTPNAVSYNGASRLKISLTCLFCLPRPIHRQFPLAGGRGSVQRRLRLQVLTKHMHGKAGQSLKTSPNLLPLGVNPRCFFIWSYTCEECHCTFILSLSFS
jgi:hypothetical protein